MLKASDEIKTLIVTKSLSMKVFIATTSFFGVSVKMSQMSQMSTSDHMLGRAIWDKLSECIFENFEIARVKPGNFKIFENRPNQTCGCWLITPSQQKLCMYRS